MKRLSISLCSLALTSGLLFSQASAPSPPSPAQMAAHQTSMFTEALSLTSDQQKQVGAILTTAANAQVSLRTSMDAAHKTLQTAVEANDSAGIAAAFAFFRSQLASLELRARSLVTITYTLQNGAYETLLADR